MPTATTTQRYFPNLKDVVPYHAETEFVQLRTLIYGLLDVKTQVLDYTLAASQRLDAELVAGKPYVFIVRQDAIGGWSTDWATNSDGTLKFKGVTLVTPVTTAGTYTAYTFIATGPAEAILIAHETGGNLS